MNIKFPILFVFYILSYELITDNPYSATIRDNKLIVIYNTGTLFNAKVRVFELKEGATTDMINSGKTFDFGRTDGRFGLTLLDASDGFQDDKNRLWVKFMLSWNIANFVESPFMKFLGYINLDDMSLENDPEFIKFPTRENFPVKDYTINTITNEDGSALYVTGGEIYSKKDNIHLGVYSNDYLDLFSDSNSFYKYNFTTKEWTDMSYSVNGKLKPLSGHKSVVIENRHLVVLGGRRKIIYNSTSNYKDPERPKFEYNSLYNLNIFDTFTNNWENVDIKADIFESNIAKLDFESFSTTVYKDKIIVLVGLIGNNRENMLSNSGYIGILDLKAKYWTWTPILNEDGSVIGKDRDFGKIKAFNDQLIICSGFSNDKRDIPISVYDFSTKKLRSTLRLSNSSNDSDSNSDSNREKNEAQNQSKSLPTYVIVLICVSCTLFLGGVIYLIYRRVNKKLISKNGKTKSNGPIREVWADPDTDNTNDIIGFNENSRSNALYSNRL